ncbi:MAG: hypothetical protein ACLVH8_03435 [Fusobacterium sp.]
MDANFDEFLEKVRNYEEKKVKIAVINVEDFGEIEVQRPTASEMLKYQKEMLSAIKDVEFDSNKADDEIPETDADKMKKIKMDTNNIDYEKFAKASSAFVYHSCSHIRNKVVRDMYPSIAFEEIPLNLFGENNIISIASQIYNAFNGKKETKEVAETIKN